MASKIGIVLALDGEAEFTAGLKKATAEAKSAQSELKALDSTYAGQENTLEALKAKQEALTNAQEKYQQKVTAAQSGLEHANDTVQKAQQRYSELKTELEQATSALERMKTSGDTTSAAYKQQETYVNQLNTAYEKQGIQITNAEAKVATWQSRLTTADAELKNNNNALAQNEQYLREAESATDQCATSIDAYGNEVGQATTVTTTWGDKVKQAFANVAATAGLQIARKAIRELVEAFKEMVSVGSEFEAAMSNVSALSGATGSSLDQLTEKAKELGNSTKFTATEVADAFSYMALAGWDTQEALEGIDGVLQLAAASGMELADASDMITDYLTAFNMEASEATTVADMLAYAQANSNTTTEQLGEAYKNCAANMNAAGQDIETVTSLLEAMANQGYKGSQAGTALKAVMRDITNNMKDGAIAIGDTNVQVADSEGNFRDLTDILVDVEAACQGMGDAEQQAALSTTFTSRSVSAVNMILNEGVDAVSGYEDALRSCDGAAQDMADTMQDNLQGDMTRLNSAIQGLQVQVYDYFEPALRGITQFATGVINTVTDVITPVEYSFQQSRDQLNAYISDIKQAESDLEASVGKASTIEAAGVQEAASIQALGNEILSLNSVTEMSAFDQQLMSSAVSELSGTIPALAAAYDEETNTINLSDDAIKNLIDSYSQLAIAQAAADAASAEQTALAEAQLALAEAEIAGEQYQRGEEFWGNLAQVVGEIGEGFNGTEEGLEQVAQKSQEAIDMLQEGVATGAITTDQLAEWTDKLSNVNTMSDYMTVLGEVEGELAVCTSGVQQNAEAEEELQVAVDDATDALEKKQEVAERAVQDAQDAVDAANDQAAAENDLVEATDNYTDSAARVSNVVNIARQGVEDLGDAEEEAADETDDLTDSMDAAEIAAQAEAEAAEAAAQRIQSAYTSAFDDVTAAYDSVASEFANGIDLDFRTEFNGGADETVEEMMATAEANIQALQDYANNLDLVSQHVGQEIAPEFMQYLESLGTDGANTLQHIANTFEQDNGAELIAQWSDQYLEQLDIEADINQRLTNDAFALEYGLNELGSTDVEWQGLQDAFNEAVEIAGGASDDIQAQFESAVAAAQSSGVAIPEGLADGLSSGEFSIEDATDQIYAAMLGRFDALAQLAEDQGFEVTDSLREGVESGVDGCAEGINQIIDAFSGNIEGGSGDIESATQSTVTEGAQAGVEESAQTVGESAQTIDEQIGEGIEEGGDVIEESVETVMEVVPETIESKAEEAGEAAKAYPEEIANGIESGQSDVTSAVENLVQGAVEAVSGHDGEFREAGEQSGQAYGEGIATGEGAAAESAQALANAVITQVEGLSEEFSAAGQESGSAFGEGIAAGSGTAESSGQQLAEAANDAAAGMVGDFESTGSDSGEAYADGIDSEQGSAQSSAQSNAQAAVTTLNSFVNQFQSTGSDSGSAYASGLLSQQSAVNSAAQSLASGALSTIQGYVGQFNSVGSQIAQGVASGINSGASAAISAAANMASQALQAAKDALDIASPSKKFKKEVGKMVGKGFAEGIDDSSGEATKSAEEMSNNVYSTATAWLKKYKKSHNTTLADEEYFWKQMTKQCEVGTTGYNKAAAKMITASVSRYDEEGNKKSTADYYSEIYSAAQDYYDKTTTLHDMSVAEEMNYWEQIQRQLKKGTDAWYDAQKQINSLASQQSSIDDSALSRAETTLSHIKSLNGMSVEEEIKYWESMKDQLTAYSDAWYEVVDKIASLKDQLESDVTSSAKSALERYTTLNELTLTEEIEYWENVRAELTKYSDDWYDVTQTINDLRSKYYDEMISAASDYASNMEVIDAWSASEQLAYWQAVQAETKKGTDAWYSAQKQINSIQSKIGTTSNMTNLLSAYTTYYDLSEKAEMEYWDIIRKQYEEGTDERLEADQKYFSAKEKYNSDLIDLEEDYADKMAEIDKQLASDIQSLTDQYVDAIDSRVDTLKNAYNLFDEFTSQSATGQELLYNIETQALGYEAWSDAIDELAERGILSDELLTELTEMGPEQLAAIYALSDLTDEELTAYQNAFDRKMSAIQSQAEKENADLLSDIEKQTEELNAQAEKDKDELTAEYNMDMEALNESLSDELNVLANNALTIADDQTTALVAAISEGVDGITEALNESITAMTAAIVTGTNVATSAVSGSGSASAVSSSPTASTSSSSSSSDSVTAAEVTKILDIINTGSSKTSLSAKQRANHSDLYCYLVDNYQRGLTTAKERKLGKALDVDTDKSGWKKKTLSALQKKGFRRGGTVVDDDLAWMDEELDRLGPELVVSRRDNALLTRLPAGSDIIDANSTSNLLQLAKVDPNKLLTVMAAQQAAADNYLQEMDAKTSINALNNLISTNMGTAPIKISTAKMEEQIDDLSALVGECVTLLTNGQDIYIDGDKLVGSTAEQMGIQLAKMANRSRR